jgi:hypothetical protein
MRIRERYELAAELKDRYRQATKRERGELLDAFCLASAYERKHAIKVATSARSAHVEQKNWTLVRRLIGYQRLDAPEQLAWLDRLYTELLRPYNNCFNPS